MLNDISKSVIIEMLQLNRTNNVTIIASTDPLASGAILIEKEHWLKLSNIKIKK